MTTPVRAGRGPGTIRRPSRSSRFHPARLTGRTNAAIYGHYWAGAVPATEGAAVATIPDLGPAARDLTQGTAGLRAEWYSADGTTSRPYLDFIQANGDTYANTTNNVIAQRIDILVVAKNDTTADAQTVIQGNNTVTGANSNFQASFRRSGSLAYLMYPGTGSGVYGGTPDTSWHLVLFSFNQGSSKIVVDGTSVALTGTMDNVGMSGVRLGSGVFDGRWAYALIYAGSMEATTWYSRLHAELARHYRIPVA